jgi:hypothetical protein
MPHPPAISGTNPNKQKSTIPHEELIPNTNKHEDSHFKTRETE